MDFEQYNLHKNKETKNENMGECHRMCEFPTDGRRETYPSGRKYFEMDVLALTQHEQRNHWDLFACGTKPITQTYRLAMNTR